MKQYLELMRYVLAHGVEKRSLSKYASIHADYLIDLGDGGKPRDWSGR